MIQTDKGMTTKYMQTVRGKHITFYIVLGVAALYLGYRYYRNK
jgi:hypothetical protein